MELRTSEHVETAERNRDLARALLAPPVTSTLIAQGLRSAPYEWIAVIAFYGAVHYVNAFLWERNRAEPVDHGQRSRAVRHDYVLQRCRAAYDRLRNEGFQARYTRRYRLLPQRAQGLVSVDLANVESVVMGAL